MENNYTDLSDLYFGRLLSTDNACGVVRVATHRNGDVVVSKSVPISPIKRPFNQEDCLRREISSLMLCKHPNIINIVGTHTDEKSSQLYLFTPYSRSGDLSFFMDCSGGLSLPQAHSFFRDIVNALNYLHNKQFLCHRDIKPENIIIFGEPGHYVAKLCDLGFATNFPTRSVDVLPRVGTPLFASIGLLTGCFTNPYKNDIWSLGVTLYNMVYNKLPFDADDGTLSTFIDVLNYKPLTFPSDIQTPKSLKDLIVHMIHKNELNRYYIEDVMESDWVKSEPE